MRKLLIVFVILQALDMAMSYLVVRNYGVEMEVGPGVNLFMRTFGFRFEWALIIAKAISISLGCSIYYYYTQKKAPRYKVALIIVNIIVFVGLLASSVWATYCIFWEFP